MMEGKILDNKAVQKYLRQVRRVYSGNKVLKKQFIQDLQDALLCYTEKNPKCSYADLVEEFGTPNEIRESFSDISTNMLKKRNVRIYWFIILLSALITFIIVIKTAIVVKESFDYSQGYYVEYMEDDDNSSMRPTSETPEITPIKEYTFD